VRFRWWELALAVLLAGLAAIFFVADDVGGGIVLTALLVLGLASRATIVERQVAGSFAKRRGYLLAVQWIALAAIYVLFTSLAAERAERAGAIAERSRGDGSLIRHRARA
jgi:hypothetical protein